MGFRRFKSAISSNKISKIVRLNQNFDFFDNYSSRENLESNAVHRKKALNRIQIQLLGVAGVLLLILALVLTLSLVLTNIKTYKSKIFIDEINASLFSLD